MHSEKWELNLSQESSQKLENFRDSRTRFFPDCAGKKRFSFGEHSSLNPSSCDQHVGLNSVTIAQRTRKEEGKNSF
jgi:hypothetical protein